ncbi:glutathione S-transferase family protein [Pacificimonas sp. ICDLI1SI03]
MMKLHWSPSAPFVRKVMVCAHALELADRIECVRSPVGPTRLNPALMADNPLNKLPTLVTPEGLALFDSRVICEYLDTISGGGVLFPAEPAKRFQALAWQCLGDGLTDVTIIRRDEFYRGEGHRSSAHQKAFVTKMGAVLDRMDQSVEEFKQGGVSIGTIAISVALSYLDFRPPGEDWREGRPALEAWQADFATHPAMVATEFDDGGGPPKQFPFYEMG